MLPGGHGSRPSAAFVLAAVALLAAWTVHNGVRFGDYTVARGGNTRLPFERVFLTDRIVRPENGPASRELARAVRRELLPQEPYRSYGIHLDDFFSDPSPRMKDDLGALANRKWGWENDERILRDVGIEAVRAHPGHVLTRGLDDGLGPAPPARVSRSRLRRRRAAASGAPEASGTPDTIVIGGRTLPRPTEGERIPAPHEGGPTSPDGSIYTVWTSPTEHHLVFVHAGDEERYVALHQRMDELRATCRTGPGTPRWRSASTSRHAGFRRRFSGSCSGSSVSPFVGPPECSLSSLLRSRRCS